MDNLTKRAAEQKEARERLIKLVRMYLFANQSTVAECAQRMRICPGTLYRRLKDPGDFTLSELYLVRDVLGIPASDLMEAVRPLINNP